MRKARAVAGFAGLLILCAASYLGVRVGVDAIGWGEPPPEASRPGIAAIVSGPAPEAPVPAKASTFNLSEGVAPEQGAAAASSPVTDTVSSEPTAGEAQTPTAGGKNSGGATSANETSAGSPSSSAAPEPEPVNKEEPPPVRYP